MMNYLKNQRGSALAIALVIIVIFSILGVGLLTINASASKQFTNKEQQVQARHFAEMGLVHYKSVAEKVMVAHNNSLNLIKISSSTEEEIVDLINAENNKICDKLTDSVTIFNPINGTDPNYDISLLNCNINSDKTNATVGIRSDGKSTQGKIETIDLNLSIVLPGTITVGAGIITSGIESNKPNQSSDSLITHENLTTGGNEDFIDKNIHINQNYTAHNIKNFNNSYLFVDGYMTTQNFTKGLKESILYTGGNLFSHNGTGDFSDSIIYVGGNFTVSQINGKISKSKIFVLGDLEIKSNGQGSGEVLSNSKICVIGDIITSINKYQHNGTNILSLASMKKEAKSKGQPEAEATATFNKTCGSVSSTLDTTTNLDNSDYIYQ